MTKFAPRIEKIDADIKKILEELNKFSDIDHRNTYSYSVKCYQSEYDLMLTLQHVRDAIKHAKEADEICPFCNHLWSLHDAAEPYCDDYRCDHIGEFGSDCMCSKYEDDDLND